MPPLVLRTASGESLRLGKKLGEGGEGSVFAVQDRSELAAKLYLHPPAANQIDKLKAMITLSSPALRSFSAWPIELLYQNQTPLGFTMPMLASPRPIHDLYWPKKRQAEFPQASWKYLIHTSLNLSTAFESMHARNIVVGDINSNNIMVERGGVIRLIDCDSFQVSNGQVIFPCLVGVAEYQPPELQNRDLTKILRSAQQDAFGLATMIFQLLFMGRHPFAGNPPAGAAGASPSENISAGFYFYGSRAAALGISPPPGAPLVTIATSEIGSLFERAFVGQPQSRPTATEWRSALARLETGVVQCKLNTGHFHLRDSANCPWCQLDAHSTFQFFISANARTATGADFWVLVPNSEIEFLWKATTQVAPKTLSISPEPTPKTTPAPLPEKARRTATVILVLTIVSLALTIGAFMYFGAIALWGAILVFVITRFRPNVSVEYSLRKARRDQAFREFGEIDQRVKALAGHERFLTERRRLEDSYKKAMSQRDAYDSELRELERRREELQRDAFLDKFEIEQYKIPNIGEKRKQVLMSYGIETAADVTQSALSAIPRFGYALISELLNWRASCERGFRFDPKKPVDPKLVVALKTRYTNERMKYRDDLKNGVKSLSYIAREEERLFALQSRELGSRTVALAQADADLSVFNWMFIT